MSFDYDVVIIGAGAAGLMCAIEAGKRGRCTRSFLKQFSKVKPSSSDTLDSQISVCLTRALTSTLRSP